MKSKRKYIGVIILLVLSLVLTACGGSSPMYEEGSITAENADENLAKFNIGVKYSDLVKGEVPEFAPDVSTDEGLGDFMYEMPSVDNYPLIVKGEGDVNVEIVVPKEEKSTGLQDFITYAASNFNLLDYTLQSGEKLSVSVRAMEAKLAEDYILTGTYRPGAYIAPNELYGLLLQENGIQVSMVTAKTVGNTMGIVFAREKYEGKEIRKLVGSEVADQVYDAAQY